MEIARQAAELVLAQVQRKCSNCKKDMQSLSTRCISCGSENPYAKVAVDSYYEHYEITKCEKHGRQLHWCIHPEIDSKLEDLMQICVACAKEVLDGASP